MANDPSAAGFDPESEEPARWSAIPAPAVRRLCLYLRELEGLLARNRLTVSSKELGQTLGYTDAQVRKDLAYFGHFGQPGIGYRVEELIARIKSILGTDKTWNVVLVGAGNLGQALATYRGFFKKGFRIVGVFDNNPAKMGQRIGEPPGLEILPMERLPEVVASAAGPDGHHGRARGSGPARRRRAAGGRGQGHSELRSGLPVRARDRARSLRSN